MTVHRLQWQNHQRWIDTKQTAATLDCQVDQITVPNRSFLPIATRIIPLTLLLWKVRTDTRTKETTQAKLSCLQVVHCCHAFWISMTKSVHFFNEWAKAFNGLISGLCRSVSGQVTSDVCIYPVALWNNKSHWRIRYWHEERLLSKFLQVLFLSSIVCCKWIGRRVLLLIWWVGSIWNTLYKMPEDSLHQRNRIFPGEVPQVHSQRSTQGIFARRTICRSNLQLLPFFVSSCPTFTSLHISWNLWTRF